MTNLPPNLDLQSVIAWLDQQPPQVLQQLTTELLSRWRAPIFEVGGVRRYAFHASDPATRLDCSLHLGTKTATSLTDKIGLIKLLRNRIPMDLSEAKRRIESILDGKTDYIDKVSRADALALKAEFQNTPIVVELYVRTT